MTTTVSAKTQPSTVTAASDAPAPLRLLISCHDRPGIVSAVSQFLFEAGANIVRSDQHSTDPMEGHSSSAWSSS